RKRLRRRLDDYQRNVPPHVRAARIADEYNLQKGRPRQYQSGGWISYVMTLAGPEPLEVRRAAVDYDHYVTRQLQTIADAILPFVDDSFSALIDEQLGLFLAVRSSVPKGWRARRTNSVSTPDQVRFVWERPGPELCSVGRYGAEKSSRTGSLLLVGAFLECGQVSALGTGSNLTALIGAGRGCHGQEISAEPA